MLDPRGLGATIGKLADGPLVSITSMLPPAANPIRPLAALNAATPTGYVPSASAGWTKSSASDHVPSPLLLAA